MADFMGAKYATVRQCGMSESVVRPGHLYVVATPIGNLGDLSPRAQNILAAVDLICAEDTRNSGALLAHFGLHRPMQALHDHNEDALCARLIQRLRAGDTLALISDAGTPLISDPGFALVRAARAAGVSIIAVPGACAAIAALSISGLPSDRFVFEGFLPAKSAARRARLQSLSRETRSLIFYESSHRILECVDDITAVFGAERPLVLARELTKLYEQSHGSTAAGIATWLREDAQRLRGEFVLMAGGAPQDTDGPQAEGERLLRLLLAELPASRAARLASAYSGAARKPLYELALSLKPGASDDE